MELSYLPPSWLSENMQYIAGRWKLGSKIGAGGYAEVYSAEDMYGTKVAVKTEPTNVPGASLPRESTFYLWLLNFCHEAAYIPRVYYSGGFYNDNVLVMELLGPSLSCCQRLCGGKLSLKTVILLSIQGVNAVQFLHSKGILHRDIKPSNFLIGYENPRKLYLADLGLAKSFGSLGGLCTPFEKEVPGCLIGTPEFGSVNNDHGRDLSRRDDLEALLFSMVFLYNGKLPWFTAHSPREKPEEIKKMKARASVRDICEGLPIEFQAFLIHVRRLSFESEPDYEFLISLLRSSLENSSLVEDYEFEWMKHPYRAVFKAYEEKNYL